MLILLALLLCFHSLRIPQFAIYDIQKSSNNTKVAISSSLLFYTSSPQQLEIYNISSKTFLSSVKLNTTINSLDCGQTNNLAFISSTQAICAYRFYGSYVFSSSCVKANASFFNKGTQLISLTSNPKELFYTSSVNKIITSGSNFLAVKASLDGSVMIALTSLCTLQKFIKSLGNWLFSLQQTLGQPCTETNEIIFLDNVRFIILNGQNFQYEIRNATDLSLISRWSEQTLKFYGHTSYPNKSTPQIYFLSGNGHGQTFIVQYDIQQNIYMIMSHIDGQTAHNFSQFVMNNNFYVGSNSTTLVIQKYTFCNLYEFFNHLSFLCQPCIPDCIACTNDFSCIKCNNSLIYNGSKNVCQKPQNPNKTSQPINSKKVTCTEGFFQNEGACQSCHQLCRQCTKNECSVAKSFSVIKNGSIEVNDWMKGLAILSGIPNIRILFDKPSLLYLTLDRIWLYQYQNHQHHQALINMFESINYIENQKFIPFGVDQYLAWLRIDILFNLDVYDQYSHPKFKQIQRNHGTAIEALQNYLLFSLPTSILAFVLLYLLFWLFFNYSFSIYLRQFSLWGFLLVSLLEPNIEYLSFLFANQTKMLFFYDFKSKILMLIIILGFFVVLTFATSAYLLFHYHYQKLAKYFADDCYRVFRGFLWYGLQIGIKAVLLGFTHSFLYSFYLGQLCVLMSLQMGFLGVRIYFWKQKGIFMCQTITCFTIINSFSMIIFQFILISQEAFVRLGGKMSEKQVEIFNNMLFVALMLLMSSSMSYFICRLVNPLYRMIQEIKNNIYEWIWHDKQANEEIPKENQSNKQSNPNKIIINNQKKDGKQLAIEQYQGLKIASQGEPSVKILVHENMVSIRKIKSSKNVNLMLTANQITQQQ